MSQPSPYSVSPPRTRCARCGLIEVCGEREDEPVCSRCVWEMLDEVRRERDELRDAARTVVEELSKKPVYVGTCHVCMAFATQEAPVEVPLCDGCAGDHGESSDLPHGPAWRRLVGLVEGHGR